MEEEKKGTGKKGKKKKTPEEQAEVQEQLGVQAQDPKTRKKVCARICPRRRKTAERRGVPQNQQGGGALAPRAAVDKAAQRAAPLLQGASR